MDMSSIWKNEKSKMLAAINHQVTLSLKSIKTTFQRSGPVSQDHFLSAEFKNDFLSSANSQIEKAYKQFEIFSNVEDQLNSHDTLLSMLGPTNANRQAMNSVVINKRNSNHQMDDPIELVDSDDEAGVNRARIKSEKRAIGIDAPTESSLDNPVNDKHCSGSAAYNRLFQTDGRLKAVSMLNDQVNGRAKEDLVNSNGGAHSVNSANVTASLLGHNEDRGANQQEHHTSKDGTIQLNDSSVETISDGRSAIKVEPTQNTSYEMNDGEEMPITLTERNKGTLAVDGGANEALSRKHAANVLLFQGNGDEVFIKVKDNIKPKQESMDDDVPLVLVAVPREIYASNKIGVNGSSNGGRDNEHGTGNEKTTSNGQSSRQTSEQKLNAYTTGRSSSHAVRKSGMTNERLAREGSSNKKFKRYKCRHCDYVTSFAWHLERHMRTHTGEKPYRCDLCFKRFPVSCRLKRHMKVHANEFPFHCSLCFRVFLLEDDKNSHEMACKARLYDCYLCKKTIAGKKCNLEQHMLTHTGIKPFRCAVCMKKFNQKINLNRHLNNVHA